METHALQDWLVEIDWRERRLRENLTTILAILQKSYGESSSEMDEIAHSVAEMQMMIERYAAEVDDPAIEGLLQRRYPVFDQLRKSIPAFCG